MELSSHNIKKQTVDYNSYYILIPVVIVFTLALLSIFTWTFGKTVGDFKIEVLFKQNTAIAFFLCSIAIYFFSLKRKNFFYLAKFLSSLVLSIGVITIYQKLMQINLGIDQPIALDFGVGDPNFPGQMSLQAAILFSLLGLSLVINSFNRYLNKIATCLNAAAFFISLIGLIGYIFNVASIYQIENNLRLTQHVAVAGLMMSFAGFFIFPQNKYIVLLQSSGAAGSFARRISLASLILPALFGRIGIYFYNSGVDNSTAYATVAISCFITQIMITWISATAFEVIDRDRIGSENEKLKSTAQIDSLLSSSPFGIAFFGIDGHLIRANQIFKKFFSLENANVDISDSDYFKNLIGFDQNQNMVDFVQSIGLGKNFEHKIEVENTTCHISLNLFPVETKTQEFLGLGISFVDITNLKKIETELIAARDNAEVSSRAKSFFIANMSHEIRTPIGIIMGFVDILNSTNLSEEEKSHNMAIIKRNCRQLLNIIDDILDISKVEAGKVKIRKESINAVELLQDLKSILDLKLETKKIKIVVHISGKIPAFFQSDSTRLRQIILNICGNAIKFTREGQITLESFYLANKLYFRITDTGLGIAASELNKLFKPFSQVDSSDTREFGGNGLGLALSQKLARALGGDLILEKTALQQGSTFLISVDTGQIDEAQLINSFEDDVANKKDINDLVVISENLKAKNILIVDDSPDNRLLIGFMLKKLGVQTDTAVDGKEAIQMAFDHDYDAILMDLQMPNMGGYEAVFQLRQSGFKKPIIALTAHAMKDEKDKCLANGFSAYLTKPIDKNLLVSTLSKVISEGTTDFGLV